MFQLPDFFQKELQPEVVAAVDLGSNSFHMIVARITDGHVHILDRLKDMVRLAAGLDEKKFLSAESQQRALDCLARFEQRLRDMPVDSVRIVGTNTLRMAANAAEFLTAAEVILGHPIEIIAGREEARLIYLGVAHALPNTSEKRLVIDIGGGSTEFIIGQGFETLQRESISIGCVNTSQRFFHDGVISAKKMRQAQIAAQSEIQSIVNLFHQTNWDIAIGASGTLRAVKRVIVEMGWEKDIQFKSLKRLKKLLLEPGHVDRLNLKGLNVQRAPVFPGGVAVLMGIFESLGIESMDVSEGALREGLVYDVLGRISHEDVRERTIQALTTRYLVDFQQAERVENTALYCLSRVAPTWDLVNEEYAHYLGWAARLYEIGLSVAHEHYHKHGAYLLTYSDLAGFSQPEQTLLATLVRAHRRKFPADIHQCHFQISPTQLIYLCILLRLAVLLHRSRSIQELPSFRLEATDNQLKLYFPHHWLEQHPLTQADLEQECNYLKEIRMQLSFE